MWISDIDASENPQKIVLPCRTVHSTFDLALPFPNIEMNIGQRIPIPESFGVPPGWVEMRLIGTYPEYTMHAILYRLLELNSEQWQTRPNSVSEVFRSIFGSTDEAAFVETNSLPSLLQSMEYFQQILQQLVMTALQGNYLDLEFLRTYPQYLAVWRFRLEQPSLGWVSEAGDVEVGVHVQHRSIFVLYRTFTMDSFLDLPCHFGLKFDYFQQMHATVHSYAVSELEMSAFPLYCLECGIAVSSQQLFQEAAEFGMPRSPVRSALDEQACVLCHRTSTQYYLCKADHKVCPNCTMKNFLTDNYQSLVCCRQKITQQLTIEVKKEIEKLPTLRKHFGKTGHYAWVSDYRGESSCPTCGIRMEFADIRRGKCQQCLKKRVEPDAELSHSAVTFELVESRSGTQVVTPPLEKVASQAASSAGGEKPTPLISPRDNHPLEKINATSLAAHPQNTRCLTCKSSYTRLDRGYQCPNFCECSLCSCETAISDIMKECRYCSLQYDDSTIEKMKQKYARCHVCGLAFFWGDLIKGSPCMVCKACVELQKNFQPELKHVFCIVCRNAFGLTQDVWNQVECVQMSQKKACCTFDIGNLEFKKLDCNHFVCARHEKSLLKCRKCHKGTRVIEDPLEGR